MTMTNPMPEAAQPVTESELVDWVASQVAPYKRVRAVRFVDAVPRSASGKILRRQLRELTSS